MLFKDVNCGAYFCLEQRQQDPLIKLEKTPNSLLILAGILASVRDDEKVILSTFYSHYNRLGIVKLIDVPQGSYFLHNSIIHFLSGDIYELKRGRSVVIDENIFVEKISFYSWRNEMDRL